MLIIDLFFPHPFPLLPWTAIEAPGPEKEEASATIAATVHLKDASPTIWQALREAQRRQPDLLVLHQVRVRRVVCVRVCAGTDPI